MFKTGNLKRIKNAKFHINDRKFWWQLFFLMYLCHVLKLYFLMMAISIHLLDDSINVKQERYIHIRIFARIFA